MPLYTKHVFFINNQLVALLVFSIIKYLRLRREEVILIYYRNLEFSFLDFEKYVYAAKNKKISRLLSKLGFDLSTREIVKSLKSKNIQYFAYISWDHAILLPLINSSNCLGHYYVEEGALSYRQGLRYMPPFTNNILREYLMKRIGERSFRFRSANKGFYCLTNEAFPSFPKDNKVVLSDWKIYDNLDYKYQLIGVHNIGLFPQTHRIPRSLWKDALVKLATAINFKGAIKLHPGIYNSKSDVEYISELFHDLCFDNIFICSHDAILELEMYKEKKTIYGARSSLSIYADFLKSNYRHIEFDGYVHNQLF